MTRISIVIPVKNGASTLKRCLQSIRAQTIGVEADIIILDSMSTDGSRQIAANYQARVVEVAAGTFNHGLTRNMGVQHAKGELLFFTVQDAWLAAPDMLKKMAGHFVDPEVMGVIGQQAVPHEKDKNPLLWFKRFSQPMVQVRQVENEQAFNSLPVTQQQSLVAWDNVVAMYRKTAVELQPFVATEFGEDWIWSEQALRRGWKLLRDPSLVVWHYHHRDYHYAFRVAYTMNFHFYKFLHYQPSMPALLKPMAQATYHVFKNPALNAREKIYWIFHNYAGLLGNFFSHADFLWRLKNGKFNAVEKGYQRYCKTIPQGKQKQ